jgi:uncharacterized protein YbjT (DUF2867 family)
MIAICGATGKIGGMAARALRELSVPVTAVARDPDKAGALRELGCAVALADLQDAAALRDAFSGADQVLVIVPVPPRAADLMAEAERTIARIASALEATQPRHVLAISDYGAHNQSDVGITNIFRVLEQRLSECGFASTFVRSAEHMQNWFRQLAPVRARGELPSLHHPLTRRFPTVSAFDVGKVAAELLAMPHDPAVKTRVVHVEGPHRYCATDIATAYSARLGRSVNARELPRGEWESSLQAAGLAPSYARLVVALQDAHNAGLIDVEPGGEVRRGTTDLASAFAALPS